VTEAREEKSVKNEESSREQEEAFSRLQVKAGAQFGSQRQARRVRARERACSGERSEEGVNLARKS